MQEDLFRPKRLEYVGILTDYHPDHRGKCKSHLLKDEAGTEYVGKTNQPDHPFLVANEYISYELLKLLNLPVPKGFLYTRNGDTFFLSEYRKNAKKLLAYSPDTIIPLIRNWEDLIGIVCFDVWVMNYDRHQNNVLICEDSKVDTFFAIDHDRALFNMCPDESRLMFRHNLPANAFVNRNLLPALTPLIDSFTKLIPFIERIQNITADQMKAVIHDQAGKLLEQKYQDKLLTVLTERKDKLQDYLTQISRSGLFPKMKILP